MKSLVQLKMHYHLTFNTLFFSLKEKTERKEVHEGMRNKPPKDE